MIIKIILVVISIIIIYALLILIGSIDFDTKNADYLIVLGHKLNNNNLTKVLEYRLKGAVEYCKKYNCKIILSGGVTKNNSLSEAVVMKDYLIKNNIDENRIILEDKSIDTVENIKNCKNYIETNSKVIILSSNYHIVRAKMICRLLGINAKGIGVYTPIIELFKHLAIEELYIFIHYFRITRKEA